MAFMKFAYASVVTPNVTKTEWRNVRTASKKSGSVSGELSDNLIQRASDFLGGSFDPSKYLLTHATIIASVDTTSPIGVKTGSVTVDGFKVNRKYSNFRIKNGSDQYINNNMDAWDRPVLLKAYRTFIGGHNFVEHVQVESLSKGRIIDAVARDIGDSIYVDILIATDRGHVDLVEARESGHMGTLSMGCTVDGTICTKCGNWAADETEMCPCIKYEKGNTFFDDDGNQNRVAELCGHDSIGETGGVHFIEASWVKTPAFTGAVLRNVLNFTKETAKRAKKVLESPPPEWSPSSMIRAATRNGGYNNILVADTFLAGWDDEGGDAPADDVAPGGDSTTDTQAPPAAPFQDVEDDAYNTLKDRIRDRLKRDMSPPSSTPVSTNETLNKQASFARKAYIAGLSDITNTSTSDASLIDRVASFNNSVGIVIPVDVYRTSLRVGSTDKYDDVSSYIVACQVAIGRPVGDGEAKTLVRLGKLLARRNSSVGR